MKHASLGFGLAVILLIGLAEIPGIRFIWTKNQRIIQYKGRTFIEVWPAARGLAHD